MLSENRSIWIRNCKNILWTISTYDVVGFVLNVVNMGWVPLIDTCLNDSALFVILILLGALLCEGFIYKWFFFFQLPYSLISKILNRSGIDDGRKNGVGVTIRGGGFLDCWEVHGYGKRPDVIHNADGLISSSDWVFI